MFAQNRIVKLGWTPGQLRLLQALALLGCLCALRLGWTETWPMLVLFLVCMTLPFVGFCGAWGVLSLLFLRDGWWLICLLPLAVCMTRWLWVVLFLAVTGLTTVGVHPGILLVCLLAFEPRWLRGSQEQLVVFYDGDCSLCNRAVRWLLAEDRHQQLHYASMSGTTFAKTFPGEQPDLDAMLVRNQLGVSSAGADAVVKILLALGGFWTILGLAGGCLPAALRQMLYRLVARNRQQIMGPARECPLPTPAQAKRLLP